MRTPSPCRVSSACAIVAALALPAPALAQAINVDFGDAATLPAPSYAAAGLAGVWNAIPVLPPGQRFDLVGLDGAPIAAKIYGVGGTQMLVHDNTGTAGDDEALIDDMFIGFNAPVDLCLWIEYLEEGEYEVTTYAITPNDPLLLSPVRVDDGTPGPTDVGGAWTGAHAPGVTYVKHVVTTTNGKIGLHSGTWGAGGQAGVNALQIRPMFPVDVGDVGFPTRTGLRLVSPNPARHAQTIEVDFAVSDPDVRALEVVDVGGRLVWRHTFDPLPLPWRDPGFTLTVIWPGVDAAGRRAPAGLYFARLAGDGERTIGRALRLVRL
jgi:hypothetical protein